MVFTNWNLCVCVRVYAEDALELRATKNYMDKNGRFG